MPQITGPDGLTKVVPGFYGIIRSALDAPGPLPEFHVPLMLVDAASGFPSSWASDGRRFNDEVDRFPFSLCVESSETERIFGESSDMARAFRVGKQHGLTRSYCIAAGKLTRWTIIASSTGPVSQFTIGGYYWGFPAGWTKLRFTGGVLSYLVPQKMSRVTAAVTSGDKRIFVDSNDWVVPGQTLELGDNDTANEAVVVAAVGRITNSNGTYSPFIDLTAGTTGAFAVTDYAAVALYSTTYTSSPVFASGEGQKIVDWINTNAIGVIRAQKTGTFNGTLPITIGTATAMKDISTWGTRSAGVSPVASASDIQDFLTSMDDRLYDDFISEVGQPPRAWFVGTTDGTAQGYLRDYAAAARARADGSSMSVTAGCAWGDIDLSASDATNPAYRARLLNSQDVCLVACGADGFGSNMTLAPAVFGRRVGSGVNHNLTKDLFIGFTRFETRWKERTSGQLTTLLRAGVVTYMLLPLGGNTQPVITQGLSTLQSNTAIWNAPGDSTCSLMHRDLADFVQLVIKVLFVDTIIGEVVDEDFIRASVVRRADKSLIARGFITSFSITSLTRNAEANGWDFAWRIGLPSLTDYINSTTTVLVS